MRLMPSAVLGLLLLSASSMSASAQVVWGDDQQLTSPPPWAEHPSLGIDQHGHPHVAFYSARNSRNDIYYKAWNGSAWDPDLRLSDVNIRTDGYTALAIHANGNIDVAWGDRRNPQAPWKEIYCKRWDGSSWGADERVTNVPDPGTADNPALAVDSSDNTHLVWVDTRESLGSEIYHIQRTGGAWGAEQRLTEAPGASLEPAIAADHLGNVHLVWTDNRDDPINVYGEIYYRRFAAGAWTPEERLTNNPGFSWHSAITADRSGQIHVVWADTRDSGGETRSEVYYKRWNGSGWTPDERLTQSGSAGFPGVSADTLGNVYVLWQDNRAGDNSEIYARRWDGTVWHPEERLTFDPARSCFPVTRAEPSGAVHLVWTDERGGSVETYYKQGCPDTDEDGLSNTWEASGISVDADTTHNYILPGADPMHKDLYLEIDAMSGLAPQPGVLTDVVAAFANCPIGNPDGQTGIRLHIVADAGCDSCVDEGDVPVAPWPDPWSGFDAVKANYFGTPTERSCPGWPDIRNAKARAYRYGLFAHSHSGGTSSGLAEISGNDFMVTLGQWSDVSRDEQAGTLMHELGHTLGFRHGGSDDTHRKPNYFSVMNYTWQMPARYLLGLSSPELQLYRDSWDLVYSRETLTYLDENALSESQGLGGDSLKWIPVGPVVGGPQTSQLVRMGGPVDWNRDLDTEDTGVAADVNYLCGLPGSNPSPGETLTGYNDWANLQYIPDNPLWNDKSVQREDVQEITLEEFLAISELRFDCNNNGVPDDQDIESGASSDANANGIPDECEGHVSDVPPIGDVHRERLSLASTPNPCVGSTTLTFALPRHTWCRLLVCDVTGRLVRILVKSELQSGRYAVVWDGTDQSGEAVASGMYVIQLQSGDGTVARRLVVIR